MTRLKHYPLLNQACLIIHTYSIMQPYETPTCTCSTVNGILIPQATSQSLLSGSEGFGKQDGGPNPIRELSCAGRCLATPQQHAALTDTAVPMPAGKRAAHPRLSLNQAGKFQVHFLLSSKPTDAADVH
jgi:hypothetical protein